MEYITGNKALAKTLRELGPRIERKVTRGACSAGVRPIVTAARQNARARKRTGGLAKSAGKRVKSYAKNGVVYVAVGYLWKKGGYHAHLVEFGHRIAKGGTLAAERANPRTGKTRRAGMSKRTGARGEGQIVGRVPGYPILAPAFRSSVRTAKSLIIQQHKNRIEKEAAKLAAENGKR